MRKKKITIRGDDAFFNRTGLERVGVVGPNLDYWWAGLQAPGSSGLR